MYIHGLFEVLTTFEIVVCLRKRVQADLQVEDVARRFDEQQRLGKCPVCMLGCVSVRELFVSGGDSNTLLRLRLLAGRVSGAAMSSSCHDLAGLMLVLML